MRFKLQRLYIILSIALLLIPIFYFLFKYSQPIAGYYWLKFHQRFSNTNSRLSWLTTQKNQIIDEAGEPIILRGVNVSSINWGQQYEQWNPQAVRRAVKDWHANIIRTRVFQEDYEANSWQFFLDLERQVVQPARQEGAYVILHPWFPQNQSLPDKNTKAMWLAIAREYKSDPTVIYDLLAEPRQVSLEDLRLAYTDLITDVRKINPRTLIMVTGVDWGRDINVWVENPLPFDNIVYRTNPYNRTGEFEGMFVDLAFQKPVFIGEFGTDNKLSMQLEDVTSLLQLANQLGIGWTAWNFSASGCPCLLQSEDTYETSTYGLAVKQALTFPSNSTSTDFISNYYNPTKTWIYSDHLESGFTDYSWNAQTVLISTDVFSEGEKSLKAVISGGGALYLRTGRTLEPQAYQYFHMDIAPTNLSSLRLRFKKEDESLSDPYVLSEYTNAKNLSHWNTILIPRDKLPSSSVVGIILESTLQYAKETLYLDNAYFAKD